MQVTIEPVFRDAKKLWDTYPDLFEGPHPLKREVVEKETNKFSLGSYKKAQDLTGWSPNCDTKDLIQKVALEVADRLRSSKNEN
jgi:hypothetical protein